MKRTNFNRKLKNINKKVTLSKTKHVEVENKLNELSSEIKLLPTKGYIGKIYFTSSFGFENTFAYQPIFIIYTKKR